MTNKIVILQNSVELYEHYINDEKWEKTLSFPKGGLTYNISNGTIKFFAFEDYLYRNCLMSMQLPIYIIDEEHDIEGEYSDIGEIVDILDEIFPTNGNGEGQDLSAYLKKREARELYQPIGDYVTTDELDEVLDDYYTKDEVDDLLDDKVDIDDVYTKDEADARFQPIGDYVSADTFAVYTAQTSDILNDKLDITAYTPCDLSNYYTKIEVDNKIASGGTFDPTQYYNKSQADDRFALKREIPSLSGYATEEWVLNKNYVTNSTMQQYINNLQQQINSIIESVSGCCSEPVTLYRWITLTGENDFICSGTTKYEKQQKQQSIDNGMTWTNVVPAEYQKGAVIETDSEDCGWAPEPQYRWKAAPTSDYLCSGTSKYYKVYYEVSYDAGVTWQHVQPEQTKRGDLIEANSTDCGYIAPQYRWYTSQSEYLCSGTTKYEKQYYQVSTDGGQHWSNVSPLQTRTGAVKEYNSADCGYRTRTTSGASYCSGSTGYDKYVDVYKQVSTDGGSTWQTTATTHQLIEKNSADCGYVPPAPKMTLTSASGSTVVVNCNNSSTLTRQEIPLYDGQGRYFCCIQSAIVGDCVTTLSETFWGQKNLTSVTLPNTLERIGRLAFSECTSLSSITIPDSVSYLGDGMGGGAFAGCTKLTSIVLPQVYFLNGTSFSGCTSLTSVTFNTTHSYISLEGGEFEGCTALKHITIPKLVQIGPRAFMGCTSMESITFSNISSVPYMEPDANAEYHVFDDSNNCDILVPSNLVASFKSATGWKVYKDRIKAI